MTQEIEARITALHLEDDEGQHVIDLERTGLGWRRLEGADGEAEQTAADVTAGNASESQVTALAKEVEDFAATYGNIAEARISGLTDEEFLAWVRPMLDEGQGSIVVNGQTYDVYEDEETV